MNNQNTIHRLKELQALQAHRNTLPRDSVKVVIRYTWDCAMCGMINLEYDHPLHPDTEQYQCCECGYTVRLTGDTLAPPKPQPKKPLPPPLPPEWELKHHTDEG